MRREIRPCLVVMQPTVLPWAGYFNLIAQADDFVFLDDAQLERQSWQTRNRLVLGSSVRWVSVPVRHVELGQSIRNSIIDESRPWARKLERSVELNYCHHPYYREAAEIVTWLTTGLDDSLSIRNENLIKLVANRLGLTPRFHRASDLNVPGERGERLLNLCHHFGAAEYLSPAGSAVYLTSDGFVERSPASLRFQEFYPEPYTQRGLTEFISHLSIVDIVANIGWDGARQYVIHGGSS
jgi:hypothetical protein